MGYFFQILWPSHNVLTLQSNEMAYILVHDFSPNCTISSIFHLSTWFSDLLLTKTCVFCWSSKYGNYILQSLNHVDINLMPGFLIKSGYYIVKFIYSEKATRFCEIFTLLLTTVHTVKSKLEILQNFVAFSEYMNFKRLQLCTYILGFVL